jgi:type VI secretion system protein
MAGRGLLHRIGSHGPSTRAPDDVGSIIEHLRVLLNARRGQAPAASDFGLPDFTDLVHGVPASLPALQRAIRDTIAEFEPRLKNVSVRHIADEDALILRFEITARLAKDSRALKLQTRVIAGGKFDVQ